MLSLVKATLRLARRAADVPGRSSGRSAAAPSVPIAGRRNEGALKRTVHRLVILDLIVENSSYRRTACQVPEHDKVGARQRPCAAKLFAWPDALIEDEPAEKCTATRPDRDTVPEPETSVPGGVAMRPSDIRSSDE
jgi:hypothetical protein